MEARSVRALLVAISFFGLGASFRTPNFVVQAPTAEFAERVGRAAEAYRRDLAQLWLGKTLPNWAQPCPIRLQVGPHLGAGGATSFVFDRGEVFGWQMTIQGSRERILDSVLPHEITHTIFATHFRRPLPRWADEGACTTVEHPSEKAKQQRMLIQFLQSDRGISFSKMFRMKEYPRDILPLYSQGYSLARFLIEQWGRRKYIEFLADGLRDEQWSRAIREHYGFESLAALQNSWLDWVRQGSPQLALRSAGPPSQSLASADNAQLPPRSQSDAGVAVSPAKFVYRGQDPQRSAAAKRWAQSKQQRLPDDARLANGPNGADAWRSRDQRLAASQGQTPHAPSASPDARAATGFDGSQPFASSATAADRLASQPLPASGKLADGASNAPATQVTRPQPYQSAEQRVLEWQQQPPAPLHVRRAEAALGGSPGHAASAAALSSQSMVPVRRGVAQRPGTTMLR